MKRLLLFVTIFTLLCLPDSVLSEELSQLTLNKLMDLSGLNKQVAEFPGMVSAGIDQAKAQGGPMPDAESEDVTRAIENAFEPAGILTMVGAEIRQNISETDGIDLLVWYESELGRKITKAEESASTPEAYQEMLGLAQSLLQEAERVSLAKKIEELVNATDMLMALQEKVQISVITAISTLMNPENSANEINAFKAQISAQQQQMRAQMKQIVILSYVYSYKDLELDVLEQYTRFLNKPVTMKFNDSVMQGMKDSLNQSIEKMASSLADTYAKHNRSH